MTAPDQPNALKIAREVARKMVADGLPLSDFAVGDAIYAEYPDLSEAARVTLLAEVLDLARRSVVTGTWVAEPTVKPVKYWVSCVPEDHPDANLFTLCVEYMGPGRWAVRNSPRNYAADGTVSFGHGWDREPVTDEEIDAYNRSHEEWLAAYRFPDEDTALRVAREQAPRIAYRGYTVQDALDRAAESAKEDPLPSGAEVTHG